MTEDAHVLDRWVFEGGYSASWPDRLARADTLIWLDLPLTTRLCRILQRRLQYHGRTRPDLPARCPERLDPEFLAYVWRTRQSGRAKAASLFGQARADQRTVHLKSGKAARGWIHALRYAATRGTLGISHRE